MPARRLDPVWRTGPALQTQGLEIFLFSSDLTPDCNEVRLKTNCEKHMDEVAFFELTQLLWTFGLCKRTHILRNSSGYVMPGLQPQSHWGPRQGSPVSIRVSRGIATLLSSHVRGIRPQGAPTMSKGWGLGNGRWLLAFLSGLPEQKQQSTLSALP